MRRSLFVFMLISVLLTGCNGLNKMKSNANKVRYAANPSPVETMDDKVVVKFTGSIPEKYFDKNCVMFLQPVFTWEGGNIPLEPMTLKGEKVDGDGTIINYANGGRFTYSDMFDSGPTSSRSNMANGRTRNIALLTLKILSMSMHVTTGISGESR